MHRAPWTRFAAFVLLAAWPTVTTAQPTTQPGDADAALARLVEVYDGLTGLRTRATTVADYDVAGRTSTQSVTSTGAADGAGRFRLDVPGQLAVAANDAAVFVELPGGFRHYRRGREAGGPLTLDALGPAAVEAMLAADPSLLLAVAADPAGLLQGLGAVSTGDDGSLNVRRPDGATIALTLDPQTGLIASAVFDHAAVLKDAGVPEVLRATRRTTYKHVEPDADVAADEVAYAPPATSQETPRGGGTLADARAGEPAPPLELPDLDGKKVTLGDLEGRVVVVTFWASWNRPFADAMPALLNFEGVAVLAVNVREEAEVARRFASENDLDVENATVLLDVTGAAARRWGVGPLPHTVVIGRDGTVRAAVAGVEPARVRSVVAEALAQNPDAAG